MVLNGRFPSDFSLGILMYACGSNVVILLVIGHMNNRPFPNSSLKLRLAEVDSLTGAQRYKGNYF